MAHQVRPLCVAEFADLYANILVRHRAHKQVDGKKTAAKNVELTRMNTLNSFGPTNSASMQSYEAYVATMLLTAKACYALYRKEDALNQKATMKMTDAGVRALVLRDLDLFKTKGFWQTLRVAKKAVKDAAMDEDNEKALKLRITSTLIDIGAEEYDDENDATLSDDVLSPVALLTRQRLAEAEAKQQREAEESKIAYVDKNPNTGSMGTVNRTVSRDDEDEEYEDGYHSGSDLEGQVAVSNNSIVVSNNSSSKTANAKSKPKRSAEESLSSEECKKIAASNKKARREQAGNAAMNSENSTAELMGSLAEQIREETAEKRPELRLWTMLTDRDMVPNMAAMREKMIELGVTKKSVGSVVRVPAAVAQLASLFKLVAGEAFKEAVTELEDKKKKTTTSAAPGPAYPYPSAPYYPYAFPPQIPQMPVYASSSASSTPATSLQFSPQQLHFLQQVGGLPQTTFGGFLQPGQQQQQPGQQHQQQQQQVQQQPQAPAAVPLASTIDLAAEEDDTDLDSMLNEK